MVVGGSRATTASTSIAHSFLGASVYPLVLALLSLDILFSEKIRDPGCNWKGKLKLLQTLQFCYNVLMVPLVLVMVISAIVGTLVMSIEKLAWVALEVITLRLLSFTSLSRGTQDLMEVLNFFIPYFPTKEIQLRVNISDGDIGATKYREPYIEQGGWSSFFVIQFEFPDPKLRDEAVSILVFNATSSLLPVSYSAHERRVIVLSPLGWVESLNVVRLLKLYTNEHETLPMKDYSVKSRWHDTRNNSIRELTLVVERTERVATKNSFVTWMPGDKCVLVLEVGLRDTILQLLPDVFEDLNLLPDMARSTMGHVYMSGVALGKLILSTVVTMAFVSYLGFENFSKNSGLEGYGVLLGLWSLLYGWGFEPFLGPTMTSVDSLVSNKKMAVLYCIAHDCGDLLFKGGTCSWAIRALRGSHSPPVASKAEIFMATHTLVMQTELYQVALSDAFVSRGEIEQNGAFIRVKRWIDIFRQGRRDGAFVDRKMKVE